MGIYKTYFTESNTIVKGFSTGSTQALSNGALNPVVELFYGAGTGTTVSQTNFSRYLFHFDLSGIISRIKEKRITLSGFSATSGLQNKAVHKLKMTNTIFNNDALLGKDTLFNSATRANSFDLLAFKLGQSWDAGTKFNSTGVSNWCMGKTNLPWTGGTYNTPLSTCGIYTGSSATVASDYSRYALFPYTAMTNTTATTMVATQHFSRGNEDIDMDITEVINDMLTGTTTALNGSTTPSGGLVADSVQGCYNTPGCTDSATQQAFVTGVKNYGMGLAFNPYYEVILTDEKRYVGFFNENTNTFFEPYIETTYYDTVIDDREKFYMGKQNRICLYVNVGSEPTNLDNLPGAVVYDADGDVYQNFLSVNTDHQNASQYTPFTSVQHVTKGVYCIDFTVPTTCSCPLVQYSDVWSGMTITTDGVTQSLDAVTNYITIREQSEYYNIGTDTDLPRSYGLSVSGIKSDERIKRGDYRKVMVSARVPYTVNQTQVIDSLKYRLYIKDGTSEYTVIDYTDINRTPTRNYFVIDTSWLIPNTYYVDIRLTSNERVMTYDQELRFIVKNQGLPDNLKKRIVT
tara:strand:+ start:3773 stop:5491 length:1719 start_codon:yes stop_codon:yes gene_type:complete